MPLQGRITNEGLMKSIEAANKQGWTITPKAFSISETKGPLDVSRTINDLQPTFYTELISARTVQGPNTIEFICTVPPQQSVTVKNIQEIYLIAEDYEGNDFLLAFGQADPVLIYEPEGSLRMRLLISVANVNIGELYTFKYTQATEIRDHNLDPNAHPEILGKIEALRGQIDNKLFNSQEVKANYECIGQEKLLIDTTDGPIEIKLPSIVDDFAEITIIDEGQNCATNNCTIIKPADVTINRINEPLIMDIDGPEVTLIHKGGNWTVNFTESAYRKDEV